MYMDFYIIESQATHSCLRPSLQLLEVRRAGVDKYSQIKQNKKQKQKLAAEWNAR